MQRWLYVTASVGLSTLPWLGAAKVAHTQSAATPSVARISLEEFKKALDAGTIVSVDVRAAEAFRGGHIPGSILVPLAEVQSHIAALKAAKKPIVTYCA